MFSIPYKVACIFNHVQFNVISFCFHLVIKILGSAKLTSPVIFTMY